MPRRWWHPHRWHAWAHPRLYWRHPVTHHWRPAHATHGHPGHSWHAHTHGRHSILWHSRGQAHRRRHPETRHHRRHSHHTRHGGCRGGGWCVPLGRVAPHPLPRSDAMLLQRLVGDPRHPKDGDVYTFTTWNRVGCLLHRLLVHMLAVRHQRRHCRHPLATEVALEMLGILVLDEGDLVLKLAVTVPAEHLVRDLLLLATHR
mmetsp:Transcript_24165/g.63064  ORF Transcript_24165/g.63064 Transcript_24165/m.63064 type:complete len:202 (-) Transcript_24165:14-619(-)